MIIESIGIVILAFVGAGVLWLMCGLPKAAATTDVMGNSALHLAVIAGSVERTKAALKTVPVDALNKDRRTPLHLACREDARLIVQILLEAGADPKKKDHRGRTPLQNAALMRAEGAGEAVAPRTFEKGGVDFKDQNGQTALALAAMSNSTALVDLLTVAGADVNTADDHGLTPLHHAAHHVNIENIRILRRHGASATAKCAGGSTPQSMLETVAGVSSEALEAMNRQ